MLDKQLVWISKQLSGAGIRYWLDSGTLLGMCRDGELIPSDEDIDIGVLEDHAGSLTTLADSFKVEGYTLKSFYIFNKLYKIKLTPPDKQRSRTIDIAVYRRHKEMAWCPARKWRSNPYRRGTLAYYSFQLMRRLARIPKRRHSDRWPMRKVIELKTWYVPVRYFQSLVMLKKDGVSLPIPEDWSGYLELRYGEWKKPAESWSYWTDDGCLKPDPPQVLLE